MNKKVKIGIIIFLIPILVFSIWYVISLNLKPYKPPTVPSTNKPVINYSILSDSIKLDDDNVDELELVTIFLNSYVEQIEENIDIEVFYTREKNIYNIWINRGEETDTYSFILL